MSVSVKEDICRIVQNHNQCRQDAVRARWELIVHRQVIGFITRNHKFVHCNFPIPEKIVAPGMNGEWDGDGRTEGVNGSQQKKVNKLVGRNFGDQLDWWERVGRWK